MRLLDRLTRLALCHRRAIGVVGAIWFALSCAVTARFITLPEIPWLNDRMLFWAASAWNAVWWGFLNPALQRRMALLNVGEAPQPEA
jgi:hypothetical protein